MYRIPRRATRPAMPTIRDDLAITLHRDGTVSYWAPHLRSWIREQAAVVPPHTLAAMPSAERQRIRSHAERHPLPQQKEA